MSAVLASSQRLAYGLFGMPLALAALPVYVYVPQLYASRFALPLAQVGAVLLAARALDAFADPLIGAWIDRREDGFARAIGFGAPLLALGFCALFLPPALAPGLALAWLSAALGLTYLGYSMASIAHQGWGAALTQAPGERARLAAVREGCALGGVVLAALVLQLAGVHWLIGLLLVLLAATGARLLLRAPRAPLRHAAPEVGLAGLLAPFRGARFRWLFAVYVCNGIAAAIPATLFLFYAADALQLADYGAACLLLYFLAAAIALPAWTRVAQRFGEARAWLAGMLVAVLCFVGAYWLPAGSLIGYAAVCAGAGFALGADLALPPALLAGVIAQAGHSGQREGAYFGAWNWAAKANLALAAGIALPLLALLGYTPGTRDPAALEALRWSYALLPCLLKLAAAALLARAPLHDL